MRGIASIEVILILALLLGSAVPFAQKVFPGLWEASEKMSAATAATESAKKILQAVHDIKRGGIGSKVDIVVYLPRYTEITCSGGSNKLVVRVWNEVKEYVLPMVCASDVSIGPGIREVTVERVSATEVGIG